MQTLEALWRLFAHAGVPARAVIAAVALLAASRLSWIPDDVRGWVSARYRLESLSWRVWRARVRRYPFSPGARVLCPDGTCGVVIGTAGCDRHPECQPAAVVAFEAPGQLPRIVPLAELVPVPRFDTGKLRSVS